MSESPLANKRILVVDDEAQIVVLVKELFEKELGVECFGAFDGMEGLKILNTEKVDLLCTDLRMPNMNGSELITKLRTGNQNTNIPVLIMTGYAKELDEVVRTYDDIMIMDKPLKPRQLLSTAKMMLVK